MCECYQIGGRFIAEDPSCPTHGTEAQSRTAQLDAAKSTLSQRIQEARTVEDFRGCMLEILELVD